MVQLHVNGPGNTAENAASAQLCQPHGINEVSGSWLHPGLALAHAAI